MKTLKILFFIPFVSIFIFLPQKAFAFPKGQWIWTQNDLKIYKSAKQSFPDLIPTVWSATFFCDQNEITKQLAFSPGLVQGKVSVLIRINDSCHSFFQKEKTNVLAQKLNIHFQKMLKHYEFYEIAEIQIDYDCPGSFLKKWSDILGQLKEQSLKEKRIWVTSLASHLQDDDFSQNLKGKVDGHILQLFDMGKDIAPEVVFKLLRKQDLPFRIGLGAFERSSERRKTQHRQWFAHNENIKFRMFGLHKRIQGFHWAHIGIKA